VAAVVAPLRVAAPVPVAVQSVLKVPAVEGAPQELSARCRSGE
jgi:hypothetical protein